MLPRPRRLVLVGSVLVDILLYVAGLPPRGGDLLAERTLIATGGGFNVLAGAARLGLPAAYAGRVGDGPFGAQTARDLAQAGVTLLLPLVAGEETGFDVGLAEPDGIRTFITAPGCESRLTPDDLARLTLSPGDAVYISGYDVLYPVSGAALATWLPALDPSVLLVLDPGPLAAEIPAARLQPILARTSLLSLNAREAAVLTGADAPAEAARLLAARVAPEGWVVVRAGERGCWLAARTDAPLHVPARPTDAVDPTGAGDAHVAAFLARLAAGDTLRDAAWAANVAASLAIERRGPATCPTAGELDRALRAAPRPA